MTWDEIQQGPAFGFTVVALIVVFGPLVAARLRMPGLLGLLPGGALIGPHMVDVLARSTSSTSPTSDPTAMAVQTLDPAAANQPVTSEVAE